MKIFYTGFSRRKSVPFRSPVEADLADTRLILNLQRRVGAFVGVFLGDGGVLRLIQCKDALLTAELASRKTGLVERTTVNIPMAEHALEAAFNQADVKSALDEFFVKWTPSGANC